MKDRRHSITFRILLFLLLIIPVLILTEENAETVRIRTKKFKTMKDKILFMGHTEIIKGEMKIVSESAEIDMVDGEERYVKIKDGVYVEFEDGTATALELDYDLKKEEGVLRGKVNILLKKKKKDEKDVKINCSILEINLKDKIYKGKGSGNRDKVHIVKGEVYITGDEFVYSSKDRILTIKGSVSVDDREKKRKMQADIIRMNLEEDTVEAEDVSLELVIEKKKK